MKALRLCRFAAAAALVGASTIVVSAPPSRALTLCGFVRVNGIDLWPLQACNPPCPTQPLVDNGLDNRNTNWVFICLVL
ncbi:MAG: hypothetical protein QOF60_1103 [Actinomycetota bacterium]|jgi:hypothetical protein|nr:hypothetical protein [Actinomycetota bacterium]